MAWMTADRTILVQPRGKRGMADTVGFGDIWSSEEVRQDKVREDVVYGNEAWSEVAAVKNRRVVRIPEALLGRPGPRLVQGYRALCRLVEECSSGLAK